MPVLYSIFLYMGVTPMSELDFFKRTLLLLMPKKHQPDLIYLRHVKPFKIHLFTGIQLLCLAILFILKLNKSISITFPLMVSVSEMSQNFQTNIKLIFDTKGFSSSLH